ncbi:MAG: hypothetical protein AUJ96_09380 [Armatimonadetes bacterium CG2_30_66_41]|nr:MAG: hypothetical protein AUJ96_09380 [Armatimonadetes bacterium CG2_30_66_41]
MVEAAVRRYLQQHGVEVTGGSCGLPAGAGKPVVALFTGATANADAALKQMASLAPRNVRITAVLSHSAEQLLGQERLRQAGCFDSFCAPSDLTAATEAVSACSLLVVPTLTSNTAAKVALGLLDSVPAQLIVQALAAGKPVIAAGDDADPRSGTWRYAGLAEQAPSLADLLKNHLNTLQRHGVRVVPLEELCDSCLAALNDPTGRNLRAATKPRAIITTDDVEKAAGRGHLRVGAEAIVTHAARELAIELDVELVE